MDGTVLILDDDAGVLELTSLYLKSRGFSTLACASAASALEKFEEAGGNVRILIADVTLSDGSGVETALRLKSLAPALRILFASGYSFEEWTNRDVALFNRLPAGSVGVLRKPYSARDLVAKVVELSSDPPHAGLASQTAG